MYEDLQMSDLESPDEDLTTGEPDSEELADLDAGPQTDSHRIRVTAMTGLVTQPLSPSHPGVDVEAIVAGQISLDIFPALPGPMKFTPGGVIEAGKATFATGGSVSTTGLALHRLGITTRLMSKVGDDLFGQALLQLIEGQGEGLARGMVLIRNAASAYSIIFEPPTGGRTVLHAPGDTFGADDVRYDLLETAGLFHFGGPSLTTPLPGDEGAELAHTFARAKELGVTTSLALKVPDRAASAAKADWRAILANVLPYVDVFLPGIEDLLFLLRHQTFEKLKAKAGKRRNMLDFIGPEVFSAMGRTLLDLGARIVAIKAGYRGLYLCTADMQALEQLGRVHPTNLVEWEKRELWAPCFSTRVVSAEGAGDATIAGFLMGLLRGMMPQAALSAACAVGAYSVEAADALSGVKSWPETMERIATGWPRLKVEKKGRPALNLAAAKWRWDDTYEVWIGPADRSR
jgi:sugar/nucleoside kinase (ribokinase family)